MQSEEAPYVTLKPNELEKLDKLVSEYLLFRSFKQTQQQLFLDKRSPAAKLNTDDAGARNRRAIIQRILNAIDSGDYPRILTLWDTYITQKIGTLKSTALNSEARDAEFLVHINCAIYPFRSDVIQKAGAPEVAAKVAARSMSMFKHFVETRGARLVLKGEEFAAYKNLYKIPFPPTHPQFQHLFSEQWYSETRQRIISFLEKFFAPEDEPVLCQLYQKITERSESDLKAVFRRRERKLLRFARSILSLSSDLLTALEGGKKVEKSFLAAFRNKFDSFQDVLQPDAIFDEDMRNKDYDQNNRGHDSPHKLPDVREAHLSPNVKRDSPAKQETDRFEPFSVSILAEKVKQKFDARVLEYDTISKDLVFVMHQVGDEVEGLLTRKNALSGADAAVICQTAMQGAVLLQGLVHSILRPEKEFHPEAEREKAVLVLSRSDMLGLRKALKGDFVSELGSDGISLESRSITRFFSLLASALKRIPAYKPESNAPVSHLPPHERLLTAAEIVAEYLCRLITALGTSRDGMTYLHTSGVHLTIALTTCLVALPLPDFNPQTDIYAVGEASLRVPTRARSGNGINSWCLMALMTLVANCKPHQLAVIKNGGVTWLTRALGHFTRDIQDKLRSVPGDAGSHDSEIPVTHHVGSSANAPASSASLFEMCVYLLSTVLESLDAQRMLVSSLSMQRDTESLLAALLLLSAKPGIVEDHMQVVVSVMHVLLREVTTREAAREMQELKLLRSSIQEGLLMSISESTGQQLLSLIESNSFDDSTKAYPANSVRTEEMLQSVCSCQSVLPENSILGRYIGGAVSGVSFLMRYSKRGSAPVPLFTDQWEPEIQPFDSTQRDRAKFNDQIPVNRTSLVATPPKQGRDNNTDLRSRPRILRTPNGSAIPANMDHGMELPTDRVIKSSGNDAIDQITHFDSEFLDEEDGGEDMKDEERNDDDDNAGEGSPREENEDEDDD